MTVEERYEAELERDKKKWTIRRRITLSCVLLNAFIIFFYMLSPVFIDNNNLEVLREFNSIAITIIGGNFSIILAYFGLNTYEQTSNRK